MISKRTSIMSGTFVVPYLDYNNRRQHRSLEHKDISRSSPRCLRRLPDSTFAQKSFSSLWIAGYGYEFVFSEIVDRSPSKGR